MKVPALLTLAILSHSLLVFAVLEEEALWMVECVNKTMSFGLPEAGVPPHLPSVQITDLKTTLNLGVGDLSVALWGASMAGIPFFEGPELRGISDGENWVFYDYSIYWPSFTIQGNFDWNITNEFNEELAGQHVTFKIDITGVRWWGIFNMTLPKVEDGKYTMPLVTDMSLKSSTLDTKVTVSGLGDINELLEDYLEFYIQFWLNHLPPRIVEIIRLGRFNGYWFSNSTPQYLVALLNSCGIFIPGP